MILYGIPTCDTCRKARKALEASGHTVAFRDIRKAPLTAGEWAHLLEVFGEALINRRSTTWRGLSEADRAGAPADLLAAYPALMKRPVCQEGDLLTLGWTAKSQAQWGT